MVRSIALLTLVVSTAGCPGPGGEGGEDGTDDGTDSPQACEQPGSALLEGAMVVELPGQSAQPFSCQSGWATDAPQLDATWTVQLPVDSTQFWFSSVFVDAHPDGGVVVAGSGLFARYDGAGEQLWNVSSVIGSETDVAMVVEEAGTIVLATSHWSSDAGTIDRYAADGSLIGPVAVPWNNPSATVWRLTTNGPELIIGAFDADSQGSWKTTILRLDADGNVLLRKATNFTQQGQLAVNDNDTALFGSFPTFILALDNGAVLGQLAPSVGQPSLMVGFGNDFVLAGNANGDFTVGRYSATGAERWLQTYDRAALGDFGRAIAVGSDNTMVAVGATSLLDFNNLVWFGSQPWIVGVDADGNALWSDRIAAVGEANGVAIGKGGEVYVAGTAETVDSNGNQPRTLSWLRRYDP